MHIPEPFDHKVSRHWPPSDPVVDLDVAERAVAETAFRVVELAADGGGSRVGRGADLDSDDVGVFEQSAEVAGDLGWRNEHRG